jgi:hypothetical protein
MTEKDEKPEPNRDFLNHLKVHTIRNLGVRREKTRKFECVMPNSGPEESLVVTKAGNVRA